MWWFLFKTVVMCWTRRGMQIHVGQWISCSTCMLKTCTRVKSYLHIHNYRNICALQSKQTRPSSLNWIFFFLFSCQGAEVRQGVSMMLLTVPTTGNEELDYGMIRVPVCLWLRLSKQRGWLPPPAEHNGLPDMLFEPKRFMHNYLGRKGRRFVVGEWLPEAGALWPSHNSVEQFYCSSSPGRIHVCGTESDLWDKTCTSSSVRLCSTVLELLSVRSQSCTLVLFLTNTTDTVVLQSRVNYIFKNPLSTSSIANPNLQVKNNSRAKV